jgi:hypothetical protein
MTVTETGLYLKIFIHTKLGNFVCSAANFGFASGVYTAAMLFIIDCMELKSVDVMMSPGGKKVTLNFLNICPLIINLFSRALGTICLCCLENKEIMLIKACNSCYNLLKVRAIENALDFQRKFLH